MSKYEVTYFDIRGLAEPIRILLTYIGADWKDNRLPYAGMGKASVPDDVKAKCLFGQVPLLEFDGHRLNQSTTILRFLGRKHNLAGKDELESAKADEIADGVRDMFMAIVPVFNEQDETKKAELMKTFIENTKNKFLTPFNSLAEKNGGYLVGSSRTWAEVYAAFAIDNIEHISNTKVLEDFPALKKIVEEILNQKDVKEYIAGRPDRPF